MVFMLNLKFQIRMILVAMMRIVIMLICVLPKMVKKVYS